MSAQQHLKAHKLLRKYGVAVAYSFIVVAFGFMFFLWGTTFSYRIEGIFLLVGIVAIISYARFVEPQLLRTFRVTIPVANSALTKPITIALLADLHASEYKRTAWTKKVVSKIIAAQPNLVLIAGDLINNQFAKDHEVDYLAPLAELTKFPVYYVLGNHDYGNLTNFCAFGDRSAEVMKKMEGLGIPLLKNELATVEANGQKIALFGSDDLWSRPIEYTALAKWDQKTPLLFLTHNADTVMTWPEKLPKPLFTFAGHSHGGQFTLFGYPLGDALMKLGRRCYRGAHTYEGLPFFISSGVGESTIPFRFGVRPELPIITLTPITAD